VHNNNDILVLSGDGLDKCIAIVPGVKVVSVAFITFHGDVSGKPQN
jgi:hypothetical protein